MLRRRRSFGSRLRPFRPWLLQTAFERRDRQSREAAALFGPHVLQVVAQIACLEPDTLIEYLHCAENLLAVIAASHACASELARCRELLFTSMAAV